MSGDSTGIKVVPVANQAGSAGKTTTLVTLAALLAEEGKNVLVVDLDGQANATTWLGVAGGEATSADVLLRRASLDQAMQPTNTASVHVLASTPQMDIAAADLTRVTGGEQRLRLALQGLSGVDVVLIDCPGAVSVVTVAAMVAATSVLTVTAPTAKELAGVPRLEDTVNEVEQAYNPGLRLGGIVPCIVPSNGGLLYTEALELLAADYPDLVTQPVRRSVRAPEAYAQTAPLPLHAPRAGVTDDYRAVLAQLRERGVLP